MKKFIVAWCEHNPNEKHSITVRSFGELYISRKRAREVIRECIEEDITNCYCDSDIEYDINQKLDECIVTENDYNVVSELPNNTTVYYNIGEVLNVTPYDQMGLFIKRGVCIDDVEIVEGMIWNACAIDEFNAYVEKHLPKWYEDDVAYIGYLNENIGEIANDLKLEERQ